MYHKSPIGSKIESITVKITSKDGLIEIYFTSAYMAPDKKITEADLLAALPSRELETINNVKWIIATDANAHKELWDSFANENDRGDTIIDFIVEQGLVCQNDSEKPTRSAKRSGEIKHSSPDITLTKNIDVHNWDTTSDELSDHNWVTYLICRTPFERTSVEYVVSIL